jgi:hypothetical protein
MSFCVYVRVGSYSTKITDENVEVDASFGAVGAVDSGNCSTGPL